MDKNRLPGSGDNKGERTESDWRNLQVNKPRRLGANKTKEDDLDVYDEEFGDEDVELVRERWTTTTYERIHTPRHPSEVGNHVDTPRPSSTSDDRYQRSASRPYLISDISSYDGTSRRSRRSRSPEGLTQTPNNRASRSVRSRSPLIASIELERRRTDSPNTPEARMPYRGTAFLHSRSQSLTSNTSAPASNRSATNDIRQLSRSAAQSRANVSEAVARAISERHNTPSRRPRFVTPAKRAPTGEKAPSDDLQPPGQGYKTSAQRRKEAAEAAQAQRAAEQARLRRMPPAPLSLRERMHLQPKLPVSKDERDRKKKAQYRKATRINSTKPLPVRYTEDDGKGAGEGAARLPANRRLFAAGAAAATPQKRKGESEKGKGKDGFSAVGSERKRKPDDDVFGEEDDGQEE